MRWSFFKKKSTEHKQISEILSRVADEVDMFQAIDAMDESQTQQTSKMSQSPSMQSHVYYISASPDNHIEKKHIFDILERKSRSCISEFPLDDDGYTQNTSMISSNQPITVIILWSHSYNEDDQCKHNFQNLTRLYQQFFPTIRIVFLQLNPNDQMTDNVPEGCLLLPGFDRVSRELAIFKIVEEEHLSTDKS
jgi:hypothetical protein